MFCGEGSRSYVRSPQNSEYNPKYTTKTIKHGGSSVMVWGCFSYYGVGPIHWIKTIMDQHVYVNIVDTMMLSFADLNPIENLWADVKNAVSDSK